MNLSNIWRKTVDIKAIYIGLGVFFIFVITPPILAQTGGTFDLTSWHIANGAGQSNGGQYSLISTIGQSEASSQMSGGQFSLSGGFWQDTAVISAPPSNSKVFVPVVLKDVN
ncbi:MAG: hypothetical protein H6631_02955 [Anaerolineaceae bacterium]|nr:hypothetical protein [Anaerolineaceae bacterium]MCB9099653.1 hypothetical protein [Anaerolineales bacterium]